MANLVFSQTDVLRSGGRWLARAVILLIAGVTVGLAYAGACLLPSGSLRWGLVSVVLLLGAGLTGVVWTAFRRANTRQRPVVIEGRVTRKTRLNAPGAYEFQVEVKKFGHLYPDGRSRQVKAKRGQRLKSIVCSDDLYQDLDSSRSCSLFCLPSGQCLAALQNNRLIW